MSRYRNVNVAIELQNNGHPVWLHRCIDFALLSVSVLVVATIVRNLFAVAPLQQSAISCDTPVVDLGEIEGRSAAANVFVVKNRGWKSVTITGIVASCGCMAIEPRSFPITIAPGASLDISCRVRLKNISGSFSKDIMILSDDSSHPQLRLTVVGSVSR